VVRRDERESGVRKTLNFGHTVGHAIERLARYEMRHGDCVAIGMVVESSLAERLGVAEPGTASRVLEVVRAAGLPHARPRGMHVDDIITATRSDKKARAARAEYALPARIGAMAGAERGWSMPVEVSVVAVALKKYIDRGSSAAARLCSARSHVRATAGRSPCRRSSS